MKKLVDKISYKQRINIANSNLTFITLVCGENELEFAFDCLAQYPHLKVENICFDIYAPITGNIVEYRGVSVLPLQNCLNRNNLTVFIGANSGTESCYFTLNYLCKANNKRIFYYLLADEKNAHLLKPRLNKYFMLRYKEELYSAYRLLKDEKSRQVFLQRVKAFIEGDSGYLYYDGQMEYFPKELSPVVKKGDYVVDAGISAFIFELEEYSKLVGNSGKIYAFEASPIEYKKAKANLAQTDANKNTELICLGLWENESTMQISNASSGSSVVNSSTNGSIECKLVALDDYIKDNNISKVDYIKLDIEGAEPFALKGAENTIRKYKPNMAVCVYHYFKHLWEIMDYIDSLNLGYDFYLHHHCANMCETVLYVVRPNWFRRCIKKLNPFKVIHAINTSLQKIYDNFSMRYKKVLVYGAGVNFEYLYNKNAFKNINVVAVSDRKFETESTIKDYVAIPPESICNYNPDIIYVTLKRKTDAYTTLESVLKCDINKVKFIYF